MLTGNNQSVFAKITPEIKGWIKNIAPNAQDSDCEASTVTNPSATTTTTTITTTTTTSKYQLVKKS